MTVERAAPRASHASLRLLVALSARALLHKPLCFWLMVAAVAAGTAFQIPNAANLAGYTSELLLRGVGQSRGEVVLTPARGAFLEWPALEVKLRDVPFVRAAVPKLLVPGGVTFRGKNEGAPIIGVSGERAAERIPLQRGEPLSPAAREGVLVGSALAETLGLDLGDRARVRMLVAMPASQGEAGALEEKPVATLDAVVRGIVHGGFGNGQAVFVLRGVLADELGEDDVAGFVSLHTDAPELARGHAAALSLLLPGVVVKPWQEESSFVLGAIEGNARIAAVSIAMVLFAVTIPVWALLYVRVHARREELALLRAVGFTRGDLFAGALLEGLMVGVCGIAAGAALGCALILFFTANPIFAIDDFAVRPALSVRAILEPAAVVLAATLLGALAPAVAAARLEPHATLRGAS